MGELIQMPGGAPPLELPDNPTAQDFARARRIRDAAAAQAKAGALPGQVASPGNLTVADPTGGMSTRQKVQLGAAIPAAIIGMGAGGPGAAATAGMGAHGLAGTAYDLATGSTNSNRDLITTGLTLMSQLHPATRALAFPARMATAAITNALAGSTYDLATGNPAKSIPEVAERGAGDIFAGALGSGATERAEARAFDRAADIGVGRKQSLRSLADREALTQWGEREGVPLSGADVSKSRTTSALERFPQSQLLGGQTVNDFRTRQMQNLDAALGRHLDRLEQRGAMSNPTDAGTDIANSVERIKTVFDRSADQAYSAERRMLGENRNFTPTNFVNAANDIMQNEGRSPLPPAGAAQRTAAPGRHTEVVQPGTVIYDHAGNPITLPAITQLRDLDWAQGRRYLALLGEKAYSGDRLPGKVSNASLERLHAALAADMDEHAAAQGPDFVNFRNSIDDMYGRAKDVVRDRLQPLARAAEQGGPEAAFKGMFRPGATGHTQALREFLPRDTFDRAAGTWLDQQVAGSTGASVGDQPLHSPAQLRAKLRPFIDSGQVDEMFSPEEAQWLRDYYTHSPALGTAERLVGNPSGTGQTVEIASTLKNLATSPITLGAGLGGLGGTALGGGAATGSGIGAALGTGATTVLPAAVARIMMSEPGRRFFAWQGRPTPESVSRAFYNQLVAHGMKPPVEDNRR